MSNVIEFRPAQAGSEYLEAQAESAEELQIDPLTAIDAAIRDLAEISLNWGTEEARKQAEECRLMLSEAYRQALGETANSGLGADFFKF